MERQVSRRGLITLGGLGVLAAIAGQDIVLREAFAAANRIAAMTATGRYPWVRDRIEINAAWEQELRTELMLRGIARGTTLCLIAREVVHQSRVPLQAAGLSDRDRRGHV